MYRISTYAKALSVALLYTGSAILLLSCGSKSVGVRDNIMTMRGDTITIFETDKGQLVNRYYTPLMEKYENAPEPYEEYKYGVDIIGYDSLGNVKSTFVANYAIHFINLNLWEAKGDVVVTNEKGDRLETQQLFWNRGTKRIYSNVDSHFLMTDGVIRGEGFEANEDLSDWIVRSTIGSIMVNTEPTRDSISAQQDSLQVAEPDTTAPTQHQSASTESSKSLPAESSTKPPAEPETGMPVESSETELSAMQLSAIKSGMKISGKRIPSSRVREKE